MPVQSIKSEAQYKEIVGASGLTAIQFIAPWDEASKTLAPKFDGYSSSKNFANVKFYKVDINDHEVRHACDIVSDSMTCDLVILPSLQDIGMASGVKNHTFRFLKDGQVKAEFKGDNYAALEASRCA
ncbi:BZ3500_MvSof-1268-A1-R1_Chr11-1g03248 [Microbotryum saponariae]|uniref:BZ3500_MvSof-1268-A1-R1_Chr11-1g03248 protein n=1 Tax=Microbotryum saponariae TaxID=289078 RepID=A0A2X0LUP2_9BASI|nr:BZ3501_MvSof-1269-A2-R1_Chr11g02823 [Microbotryum saponariae]SDA03811.1 BZ3500_MvSof-1268-A1-R1_Chr11-1g03248 [Microbotryum saponariae]